MTIPSVPSTVSQRDGRTLIDEFFFRTKDKSLEPWLSKLIDGIVQDDVFVPRDDHPVDYLIALLRRRETPEAVSALGTAASSLLHEWLVTHPSGEDWGPKDQGRLA
ncbi:MAG: hypothetical protein ACRDIY_10400, partial [Chloroflexota bacterium]